MLYKSVRAVFVGVLFTWSGGHLFSCESLPDHENPSGGFRSSIVNLVEPDYTSDNSRSPSTFL